MTTGTLYVLVVLLVLVILITAFNWWRRRGRPPKLDWEAELVDPERSKNVMYLASVRNETGRKFHYHAYKDFGPDERIGVHVWLHGPESTDSEDLGMFASNHKAQRGAEEHAEANGFMVLEKKT